MLLSTADREIVEESHKDKFWGTVSEDAQVLAGKNILGNLLMKIREEIREEKLSNSQDIKFKQINNLILFGEDANSLA